MAEPERQVGGATPFLRHVRPPNWVSWRAATEQALFAENGFYRRAGQPARHFRTSVHSSAGYLSAMFAVLRHLDNALGHPERLDVVDVGAGGGELLAGLAQLPSCELSARLRLVAVEVATRPPELDSRIAWTSALPQSVTGLVVANEWLDNVPVEVVEQTSDGPRLVLVDPRTGAEHIGAVPSAEELDWLNRWWPLDTIGTRAEIGLPRDEAWADVVRALRRGIAIAADYVHRLPTRPPFGTLTGYRAGRQVFPVPDGTCDVTAHVAIDACACSGVRAGAVETLLTSQRGALRALGVRPRCPPIALAHTDPHRYLSQLRRAWADAELVNRSGLGAFGWLVQAIDSRLPAILRTAMEC